jgi:hypothetical protein
MERSIGCREDSQSNPADLQLWHGRRRRSLDSEKPEFFIIQTIDNRGKNKETGALISNRSFTSLQGGVAYFLYTDVFSPDSKTAYFNRAVDRIRKDPDCLALLGDAKKLTAHGDETYNKWRRARPIA